VGSGPAGLACAQQLARAGHDVTMFEKNDRIGGLLRYGIPDFKMEKWLIDRRIDQMEAEGVTSVPVSSSAGPPRKGVTDWAVETVAPEKNPRRVRRRGALRRRRAAADLPVPGRDLDGVHFAMEFLPLQNRRVAGDSAVRELWASGKHVVVIGGGDTGSDCVGNFQPARREIGHRSSNCSRSRMIPTITRYGRTGRSGYAPLLLTRRA